jgi:hypothetical protein
MLAEALKSAKGNYYKNVDYKACCSAASKACGALAHHEGSRDRPSPASAMSRSAACS